MTVQAGRGYELSDREFAHFQRFIYEAAGISLGASKRLLVAGRLGRRLQERNAAGFADYFRLLARGDDPAEVQIAVDLLTTNETYFFREPKHFDRLRVIAAESPPRPAPFRVWSAASSTGEEAYSIAMVLADCLRERPWEVVGSDISLRVLAQARRGHYPEERTRHVPEDLRRRFCLRGLGQQAGTVLIERGLRRRVEFLQVNLNTSLPARLGRFDLIFLRNVMIYFNGETKRQVVERILTTLRPGGTIFIGHSETLNGVSETVRATAPSMYRKLASAGGPG